MSEERASGDRSAPGPGETLDAIAGGAVRLLQRRDGYRFNEDAAHLASFVLEGPAPRRVVDLGAGCGVVGLLVVRGAAPEETVLVELQPVLADLARRNVLLNAAGSVRVVEGDLRELRGVLEPDAWDLVVANPPYFAAGTSRMSPNEEKALARHETACTIGELMSAARRLVRADGRVAVVFPSARLADLFAAAADARLHPSRLRFVHPRPGEPAGVALLEATPAKRPLRVEPPLVSVR